MQWQIEQEQQQHPDQPPELVLRLSGRLTVENAEQLLAALREALHRTGKVRIEPAGDGEATIDPCCLQLFCAAHRSFLAAGRELELGPMPVTFSLTAAQTGLTKRTNCPVGPQEQCLWVRGAP